MRLIYKKYDNLNISEELLKIEKCDNAEIVLKPNDKNCLFILGMLFANGVKIKILNVDELEFNDTNKSFTMMPYVWEKLGDSNFPNHYYSNVYSDMDNRIENVKRMGVSIEKIQSNPVDNKIFLISPVRYLSDDKKLFIDGYANKKKNEGYNIHVPYLNTRQTDLFGGYAICKQNALAMASSSEVDIYYDKDSFGSVFDLGVAYALHKPLKIINKHDVIFDLDQPIDSIIYKWPYNYEKYETYEEIKELLKELRENAIKNMNRDDSSLVLKNNFKKY